MFWKAVLQNPTFRETFAELGLYNNVTPKVKSSLEKFVCLLYGRRQQESVNMVRKSKIFLQKYANDKK